MSGLVVPLELETWFALGVYVERRAIGILDCKATIPPQMIRATLLAGNLRTSVPEADGLGPGLATGSAERTY